jgi:hypothetical protein
MCDVEMAGRAAEGTVHMSTAAASLSGLERCSRFLLHQRDWHRQMTWAAYRIRICTPACYTH